MLINVEINQANKFVGQNTKYLPNNTIVNRLQSILSCFKISTKKVSSVGNCEGGLALLLILIILLM